MKMNHYFGNASDELLRCQPSDVWVVSKKSSGKRELRRERIRSATKRVRVKPRAEGFGQ